MKKQYQLHEAQYVMLTELPYDVLPRNGVSWDEAKKWCNETFGVRRFVEWSTLVYLDHGGKWDIYRTFRFLNKEDATLFKLTWG